ncbi:AfsR/SARP family transcriptional regulator [Actinophytocola sp.]|uniref:AfsR/SARP family transcriptional regulator n=1 Tax=Actinophytocola sp. TaxID=1872138 RepID=UPI002ED84650
MRVQVNVLGPLEVSVGGAPVAPVASKPSRLLALLALNAGHVVSSAALIEELWDSRPPPSEVLTLRTYVLTLRRMLQPRLADAHGASRKDVLVTRRSGYLLETNPDEVDANRYDRLSAAGHRAVNAGDAETAARTLGEALRLWRGPVCSGVSTGPQLAIEAMRLEETRLGDLYLRIEADLRLGRHHQVLGELATLCARHPLLEDFCAQHMVALCRCGRPGQALAAFQRLRANLVEQLGVEPAAAVCRLHHDILTGHLTTVDTKLALAG